MEGTQRYGVWNAALTDHCLLADSVRGSVALTVTPQILASALRDAVEEVLPPEEAEADFSSAVAAEYKATVIVSGQTLAAFATRNGAARPSSVALLGLSVLAAYRMQTDDDLSGRAYYPRLASLLGCELAGPYPTGFQPREFVCLWDDLASWLDATHQRNLGKPKDSLRLKYLAFPMAHVPLRQVDVERLPRFFETHGYEPRTRPPINSLAFDLHDRDGAWRYFTEAGKAALADAERRPLVVQQVAYELEHWDGSRTDTLGRRVASIEIGMDIRQRRARLYLLARRPPGFPEEIQSGDIAFRAEGSDWYEQVPLGRTDGGLLSDGFNVEGEGQHRGFVLNRRPASVVALVPSGHFSGFVSNGSLRIDTSCAVLCDEAIASDVARFLERLTGGQVHARNDNGLPEGWSLFVGVRPKTAIDPPIELGCLRVEADAALIPEGGLSIGHRWTWLEGAFPRVRAVGNIQARSIRIDGTEVTPDKDGYIPLEQACTLGQHALELGNQIRRRITVVPAAISSNCKAWEIATAGGMPVLLPMGRWRLLGRTPGQIAETEIPADGGVVRPLFPVAWAVKLDSGPGVVVLHVHGNEGGSPPTLIARERPRRGSSRRYGPDFGWAEAIYQTSVRRPRFGCSKGCAAPQIAAEWRELAEVARAIKRQARRSR